MLRFTPGALAPAATSFALMLLVARVLSAAQLGLFAAALSVVTIVSAAGAQWIAQPLNRYLPTQEATTPPLHAARVAGWLSGAGSSLVAAIGFALYANAALEMPVTALLIAAVAALTATTVMSVVILAIWQSTFRADRYSLFQWRFHGVRLLTAAAGALSFSTATGVLLGGAAGTGVVLAREWGHVFRDRARRERVMPWLRKLWHYGAAFIPWSLLSTCLAVGDRLIIGLFRSTEDVGLYAVQYTLATGAIVLVAMPMLLFLHPESMRRWASGDEAGSRRLIARMAGVIAAVTLVVITAAAVGGVWLTRVLFGSEYVTSPILLPILCAGTGLWQIALYAQKPTEARADTWTLAILIGGATLVNVTANLLLIPRLGIVGAGVATVLGYASYTLSLWIAGWGKAAHLPHRLAGAFAVVLFVSALPAALGMRDGVAVSMIIGVLLLTGLVPVTVMQLRLASRTGPL